MPDSADHGALMLIECRMMAQELAFLIGKAGLAPMLAQVGIKVLADCLDALFAVFAVRPFVLPFKLLAHLELCLLLGFGAGKDDDGLPPERHNPQLFLPANVTHPKATRPFLVLLHDDLFAEVVLQVGGESLARVQRWGSSATFVMLVVDG